MSEKLAVAVPMKPLALAKQRLRPALDEAARQDLARSMLLHVLAAVHESGIAATAGLVSGDREVLALAATFGFDPIADHPRRGYNAAAARACSWALAQGASALLLLPADLPYLTAGDLQALARLAGDGPRSLVIAPDASEQGTNALLLRPPDLISPEFGPGSYARHCALAAAGGVTPTIYRSPALAHDIDLPADLNGLPAVPLSLSRWNAPR